MDTPPFTPVGDHPHSPAGTSIPRSPRPVTCRRHRMPGAAGAGSTAHPHAAHYAGRDARDALHHRRHRRRRPAEQRRARPARRHAPRPTGADGVGVPRAGDVAGASRATRRGSHRCHGRRLVRGRVLRAPGDPPLPSGDGPANPRVVAHARRRLRRAGRARVGRRRRRPRAVRPPARPARLRRGEGTDLRRAARQASGGRSRRLAGGGRQVRRRRAPLGGRHLRRALARSRARVEEGPEGGQARQAGPGPPDDTRLAEEAAR